ncbi:hypothetical protein ACXJK9_004143 [Yersinia enterocolitica]|uniref:Uncharacterized protein n=1 Tax=Yersinia enterocolitica TaxID=630 RepID=A0AAD2Z6M3_YEREN|nr:hypothetical protein [Yersinia enterocolitica]EKN4766104.1 hypothetical protein [Yersinia enterocolitica]ELI8104645.1 hypothetical protein [Yersinia enterocolitica]CQR19492.1 Uncharacterised protein [Yersinia enterocolitica]CRX56236.1 Uncharacterised protein [Yersinia enterocolitica]HDL6770620.1 hypothetical protein [Yersinia enterocolitica]
MSEIKVYGLDSSLIHDADPKDGFVVDVVRFNDYVELEKKYQALVGENAAAIEAVRIFSNATEQLTEIIGDEIGMDGVSKLLHGFSIVGSMPATTQALNEIKAQGVDEFAAEMESITDIDSLGKTRKRIAHRFITLATKFAASLRGSHEIKS